jgi:addiction module HigA family antidote
MESGETTMSDMTIPAEVFHAGEFLKEELEARNLTQAELAEIMGRPTQAVSELVLGKRGVTPETAKGLAAAFGTSAEYWMNLETAYQLSKASIEHILAFQLRKLLNVDGLSILKTQPSWKHDFWSFSASLKLKLLRVFRLLVRNKTILAIQ